VVSTYHPTVDWLRKGGSYFDVVVETDMWEMEGHGQWAVRGWREPLSSLADAATSVGFLIERIVKPRPRATMAEKWPETFEKLSRRPDFLILRLVKR
jgi:hypothetical protein